MRAPRALRRALHAGIGLTLVARAAHAQPDNFAPRSLRDHVGMAVAERLLGSERPDDRLRGIERLASVQDRAGIDFLVRAFDPGTALARDAKTRLVAMRVLAPFASIDGVRQLLGRTLGGEIPAGPLAGLTRDTAALVLALSGDPRSLEVLAAAVQQEGPAGGAAHRALVAYPPRSLLFLVGARKEPLSAPLSLLLGDLGDLRAIPALRATLGAVGSTAESAPANVLRSRTAAALALARLGDDEQLAVAEGWLASTNAELRLVGARVLLESGAARKGARALSDLLTAPAPVGPGALALAAEAPSVELVAGLEALLHRGSADSDGLAIGVLGAIGGPSATALLARLWNDRSRASQAAYALAQAPGDEARLVLERGLQASGASRLLAARAGVARALLRDDPPPHLVETLHRLAASSDAADRAVSAFGLVALGRTPAAELLSSSDPAVVRAAARAALAGPPEGLVAAANRLATESDPITCDALGIALTAEPAVWRRVPTHRLVVWADEDSVLAPLAARALAAREGGEGDGARERGGPGDDAGSKQRVGRLLASPDPVIRAHAARGLALSAEPDAVGRLAALWTFEPDALVRRAIVAALSARPEVDRRIPLATVAALDPDLGAREMARAALAGRRLEGVASPSPRGGLRSYVAWIAVVPNGPDALGGSAGRPGRLLGSDGRLLPVVTDPDGFVVALGLPPGTASFNLASGPLAEDALPP